MLDAIRGNRSVSSDIALLTGMGVCPHPLFDRLSLECWELHKAMKAGVPLPWSYYEAPAIFMIAEKIMTAEESLMDQESVPDGV